MHWKARRYIDDRECPLQSEHDPRWYRRYNRLAVNMRDAAVLFLPEYDSLLSVRLDASDIRRVNQTQNSLSFNEHLESAGLK